MKKYPKKGTDKHRRLRAHKRALYKKRKMKDPKYVEKLHARRKRDMNLRSTKYRNSPIGYAKHIAIARTSYRIRRIIKLLKD